MTLLKIKGLYYFEHYKDFTLKYIRLIYPIYQIH